VASTLQRNNQEQEICSVANVTFPIFRYCTVLDLGQRMRTRDLDSLLLKGSEKKHLFLI
jgi:hypothetical protein